MDDARRLFEDEQHREAVPAHRPGRRRQRSCPHVCHLQAARTQGPPPAPCPVCGWKPCGGHTTNLPRTGLVCLQPGDLPEEVCQVQTCQTAQGTGERLPRQGTVCPGLAGRDMSASLTPKSIPVCQRPLWHCLLQDNPDTPFRPAPSAETDTQARSSGNWRSGGLRAGCPSGILPRNQAPMARIASSSAAEAADIWMCAPMTGPGLRLVRVARTLRLLERSSTCPIELKETQGVFLFFCGDAPPRTPRLPGPSEGLRADL